MTADLRRLAEDAKANERVGTLVLTADLLALLDERDEYRADAELRKGLLAYTERRVRALEGGLRDLLAMADEYGYDKGTYDKARALLSEPPVGSLAAATSEPRDEYHHPKGFAEHKVDRNTTTDPAFCNTCLQLAPAALPAEVGFPKQVGDPTNENPYDRAESRYHAQHAHTEDGYCLLNEEPDPLYSAGRGDISSYDPSQRGER